MTRNDSLIRLLLVVTLAGMTARVVLAAVSVGSFDAQLWTNYAHRVDEHGVVNQYRTDPSYNHPPAPGVWAMLALRASRITGVPFLFVFKLATIVSDAAVCALLWKIILPRRGKLVAAAVVALYAWNLDAILISSYHGSTDSAYAMLALLAVYLAEDRRADLLSGLALGAAINVKLIPLVLIVPMLGGYRDWRSVSRFVAGLAIAALAFAPSIIGATGGFVQIVLGYRAVPSYWGVQHFLLELARLPRFSGWSQALMDQYSDVGRWLMLLSIVLMALVARRRGIDRYTTCAACAAMFLVLAPGFGTQYSVFVVPVLMSVDAWIGTLYGTLAGIGAMLQYWHSWPGGWPLSSVAGGPDNPAPGPLFFLLAWATLVAFVWRCARSTNDDRSAHRVAPMYKLLIAVSFAALIAREILASYSWGSADIGIFQSFATRIDSHGLRWLYRNESGFNHPPLIGLWTWAAGRMARVLDDPDGIASARWSWFPFLFKQPIILADLLTCLLIGQIAKLRGASTGTLLMIFAMYALSPLAILLCAHHGNTDPIYAALCLLSAYFMRERRAFVLSGIALGLAINVKVIPILLVPVLAALCGNRRELTRFVTGLLVTALPFAALLILEPGAVARNVLSYTSTIDYWGINQFLLEASRRPRFSAVAQTLLYAYHDRGRWLVILAIVALIILVRKWRWGSDHAYEALACAGSLFLIFTPGFGLQYLALVAPLLFAVRPTPAVVFAITAGLFALFNYWVNWPGGLPIDSTGIATPPRAPGAQFGLLAWATLVTFVWTTLRPKLMRDASGLLPIPSGAARP